MYTPNGELPVFRHCSGTPANPGATTRPTSHYQKNTKLTRQIEPIALAKEGYPKEDSLLRAFFQCKASMCLFFLQRPKIPDTALCLQCKLRSIAGEIK